MEDEPVGIVETLIATPAPTSDVEVTSAELEEFWQKLFPDTYEGRRGQNAFLDAVRGHAENRSTEATLEFRPGGWQVKLAGSSVKGVLVGALLAGLLVAVGATGIPAAVVAAIVPSLFDIEKVRLTPSQEYVLADLVGHRDAFDPTLTADELYDRLSAQTRAEVSRLDFTEFLDACRRAGLADLGPDGTVTLRPSDKARFRITWR
jgi:hypothetical protein